MAWTKAINAERGIVDAKPPLPPGKGEVITHLEQENREMADPRHFKIALRAFVPEVEEFQDECTPSFSTLPVVWELYVSRNILQ